jgi:hypothetical protein
MTTHCRAADFSRLIGAYKAAGSLFLSVNNADRQALPKLAKEALERSAGRPL